MPLQIGLLTFPRVQQLDLTGPYEVFATLLDTSLHLIWKTLTPITTATGLILTPTPARVVRDGNIFTGGGVTAGIDFARTRTRTAASHAEREAIIKQMTLQNE